MTWLVADLGNTRLKWGRLDEAGRLLASVATPTDAPSAWSSTLDGWGISGGRCAVASVNPPVAARLGDFLGERGIKEVRWFRSAADVPLRHELEQPETSGADRALAVLASLEFGSSDRPGFVISCGTAITVERVGAGGLWEGGAILPGLELASRSLNERTAQLPRVMPDDDPPAWGRSTVPAISAGVFWGTVGAIEGVLRRQNQGRVGGEPWRIWTGGDAAVLAPKVEAGSLVIPDLVLIGLARVLSRDAEP